MGQPIGQLFWKYIRGTQLERLGWTSDKLADELSARGVIEITTRPQTPVKGVAARRYYRVVDGRRIETEVALIRSKTP